MQMFRPSNDCYEQSNYGHPVKPFFGTKPAIGYGGSNNLTQCQTQTQCFGAQLPGAGSGYGMQQQAAGAQGYGPQKPYGQYGQHGSTYGSVQHGGATHHQAGSYGSVMQGGGYGGSATQHGSYANGHQHHQGGGYGLGSGHHGSSFGSSGCDGQSGGYNYSMKKKERRSWGRKRSINDSDSSDESDHDN